MHMMMSSHRRERREWRLLVSVAMLPLAILCLGLSLALPMGCAHETSQIPPAQTVEVGPGFVSGDVFELRVFNEEEQGGTFQVQDDGTVDFPLVGRISVSGMTQAELADHLRQRLADGYIRDPNITIVVVSRQNLEVSVLGQVAKPGTFPYVGELTLVQAVSEAGGTTPYAASKRVRLTRKTKDGPKTFEISLKAITEGRAEDLLLQPGDIVFVPENPL